MRTRPVLLLVLASALGVFAYQQATKPPRYTGPAPLPRPYAPPVPAAAPVEVGKPPEAEMQRIAEAFKEFKGERVEAELRALNKRFPENPKLLTFLARLEYNHAVRGRSQPLDKLDVNHDPRHMDEAHVWATQALAVDPDSVDALTVSARVALARGLRQQALDHLQRAETLAPDNAPMRLLKADVLWSMATYTGEDTYLAQALQEYEGVLKEPIDSRDEFIALRQMGELSAAMGDADKGIRYVTRAIDGFKGQDQAFALESRARIKLYAGRADAAIKDAEAALAVVRFGVAAHTLADAHLVRAGQAMKNGDEATAARHLEALLAYDSDPTSHVNRLAGKKHTFPAVYAMYAAPMRKQHWDRVVPEALGEAAEFITAGDLRKLKTLGVRFDAGDAATNTLLFHAIWYDNVEAVRTLLALGADTSVRKDDGSTLLDAARIGTQPKRQEIRRILLAKMGRPPGWTDVPVDMPKRGHWYQAERTVGVADSPNQKVFEKGMVLLAAGRCSTPGRPFTCYTFYSAPDKYYGTILVPISSPEDYNALREVEAPEL